MDTFTSLYGYYRPIKKGLIGIIEHWAMSYLHDIQVVGRSDPIHVVAEHDLYDGLHRFAGECIHMIEVHTDRRARRRQVEQERQRERMLAGDTTPLSFNELYSIDYEPIRLALLRLEMDAARAADFLIAEFVGGYIGEMMRIMQGLLFALEVEKAKFRKATGEYATQMVRSGNIPRPRPLRASAYTGTPYGFLQCAEHSTCGGTLPCDRRKRGHDEDEDALVAYENCTTSRPAKRVLQADGAALQAIDEEEAEEEL